MKRIAVLAVCLVPVLAHGEEAYTNADLVRFQVAGAYTNADLRRLPPLAVQGAPAAALPKIAAPRPPGAGYQAEYAGLRLTRDLLAAEIALERERIALSESAFAGDTRASGIRLGYRSRVAPLIEELEKRVALLDGHLERLADDARRAGAAIDRR